MLLQETTPTELSQAIGVDPTICAAFLASARRYPANTGLAQLETVVYSSNVPGVQVDFPSSDGLPLVVYSLQNFGSQGVFVTFQSLNAPDDRWAALVGDTTNEPALLDTYLVIPVGELEDGLIALLLA